MVLVIAGAGVGAVSAPLARAATITVDPVVVAAGDIACASADANFSGRNPASCQMRATAQQIAGIGPRYLLPIGDTQYGPLTQGVQPSATDYKKSYDATWGAVNVPGMVVRPVPGNHEYGNVTGSNSGLASGSTYFANFGPSGLNQLPSTVTKAANDFYSYDIPVVGGSSWHVIALDSECTSGVGGCNAGSPEETWLRNDLAAHPNRCTIAYWHKPRWSGTADGDNATYAAFWSDLVAARAAIVLNGHEHNYLHLRPLDASGTPAPNGVTQFVVGTGGDDHEGAGPTGPRVLAQDDQDFGVLKLTLHATSASFAFQAVGGATPDSGTVTCPTAAPSASVPTVSGVSPIWGPAGGGTAVTVTGTNFAAGASVAFGGVPATNVSVLSATSLTATAPPLAALPGSSTVDVTVTSSAGTSVGSPADQFTYTLATNGYTAAISASAATAAVGGVVTLTATTNQDMGPTPYGLSIVDATTNTQIGHIGGGTTFGVVVSQSVASAHRYLARVDNPNGANTQAVSTPVTVAWG
jgi:hypothetical protein